MHRLPLLCAALLMASSAAAQTNAGPYVPTPWPIVSEMMKLADPKPSDVIYDLGSGDGRLVITAVKSSGARGRGYDINPELVKLANENAKKEGVAERAEFVRQDLFEADLSPATLITVYLLPNTVTKLVPKMTSEMRPGSRVVSHDYPLLPWQHDSMHEFSFEEKRAISGTPRTILYHYTVPAKVAGTWTLQLPAGFAKQSARMAITQELTALRGAATIDGRSAAVGDLRIRGDQVSFTLPGSGGKPVALRATVVGEGMDGTAELAGGTKSWQAKRTTP